MKIKLKSTFNNHSIIDKVPQNKKILQTSTYYSNKASIKKLFYENFLNNKQE